MVRVELIDGFSFGSEGETSETKAAIDQVDDRRGLESADLVKEE